MVAFRMCAIQVSKAERTRLSIQKAGRQVLSERGLCVPINELAAAAGVSRANFYNYFASAEALFDSLIVDAALELNALIDNSFEQISDPALRVANGIRHYCLRAAADPEWADFMLRFALTQSKLVAVMEKSLLRDVRLGVQSGIFRLPQSQEVMVVLMVGGAVLSAISAVRMGLLSAEQAGQQTAELVLRALGDDPEHALQTSRAELMQLG